MSLFHVDWIPGETLCLTKLILHNQMKLCFFKTWRPQVSMMSLSVFGVETVHIMTTKPIATTSMVNKWAKLSYKIKVKASFGRLCNLWNRYLEAVLPYQNLPSISHCTHHPDMFSLLCQSSRRRKIHGHLQLLWHTLQGKEIHVKP